jgi:AcrR family transcriptional regulator
MAADRLSERKLADAALSVIDEEGLEGLSMRKLAARTGSSAMAVYNYFEDRDALLDAAAQLLLADIEIPPDDAGWRDAIRFIMRSIREVAHRHPNAAPLIARFPPRTPDALAFVEAGFRSFHRAGFDDLSTARCYRALAAYSLGTLDLELNRYYGSEAAPSPTDRSLDVGDPTKLLPRYTAVAPSLLTQDDTAEFEYGLELLLDGFADAMRRTGVDV